MFARMGRGEELLIPGHSLPVLHGEQVLGRGGATAVQAWMHECNRMPRDAQEAHLTRVFCGAFPELPPRALATRGPGDGGGQTSPGAGA